MFLYVLALLKANKPKENELVKKKKKNKVVVDYDKHWEEVPRTIIEKNKVIYLKKVGGKASLKRR